MTGLGRGHPIENGFAWHPTLGTAFLPGSSIKGLVRAWAKHDAEPGCDRETLNRVFGGAEDTGSVCFLDAVPIAPVQLEADVMTPHYAGWSESAPPGDWMSPTPIPFLTAAAKTSFLFAIVPRRASASPDIERVADWLKSALEWNGAGAKTAVGYGRFSRDDAKTRQWIQHVEEERKRENDAATPAGRWRLKIGGKSETEVLELVRVCLEKDRLADASERQAFAEAVFSLYGNMVARWRNGGKHDRRTVVGAKKLKERARLLDEPAR